MGALCFEFGPTRENAHPEVGQHLFFIFGDRRVPEVDVEEEEVLRSCVLDGVLARAVEDDRLRVFVLYSFSSYRKFTLARQGDVRRE